MITARHTQRYTHVGTGGTLGVSRIFLYFRTVLYSGRSTINIIYFLILSVFKVGRRDKDNPSNVDEGAGAPKPLLRPHAAKRVRELRTRRRARFVFGKASAIIGEYML